MSPGAGIVPPLFSTVMFDLRSAAMLHSPTDTTERSPLSLAIMDRQQLTRDCLARLLSQALGLAVVGSCENVAALEKIVAQRHPHVALVALHSEENVEAAVTALVARLERTRVLLLAERTSPELERRCSQSGAAGCISKEQSLQGLESALRRIGAGQAACAGHDGAQLLDGQLVPAAVSFGQGNGFEPGPLGQLTRREFDVLVHIAQGYTVKQCAEALGISPSTADNHKSRLMRKLRVHKTVDLARLALRCGLAPGALAPSTNGNRTGGGQVNGLQPPNSG
jgi:DNA-binding NarL/FixJ family response regulator